VPRRPAAHQRGREAQDAPNQLFLYSALHPLRLAGVRNEDFCSLARQKDRCPRLP